MEFVYLPIYPYITSEENERGNRDMKEDGKEGDFVTRDSLDWGNVTKIKTQVKKQNTTQLVHAEHNVQKLMSLRS